MTDELASDEQDVTPEAGDESSAGELSLAELSEAYASVLKQNQSEDAGEIESEDDFSDQADASDAEPPSEATTKKVVAPTIQEMDAADNASCPISPKSIIESLLFVGAPAGEKLRLKKIAALMRDVSPKEVKKTIGELNKEYEQRNAAFRVVDEDGNYKLQLCEDLIAVQNFFFGRNKAAKLSQGAIDVLAVVAYNQPVSKTKVEKIRKRPSGSVLSQLLKRNLIVVAEEDESVKEKRYQTTDRFLELFGLETLNDLPQTSVVSDLEELTDY